MHPISTIVYSWEKPAVTCAFTHSKRPGPGQACQAGDAAGRPPHPPENARRREAENALRLAAWVWSPGFSCYASGLHGGFRVTSTLPDGVVVLHKPPWGVLQKPPEGFRVTVTSE